MIDDSIRRTLNGDRKAFEAIYNAHHAHVQAFVTRHTTEFDRVEDLVQITFLRAFRALHTFRGEAAFSTWLIQIALNVCRSDQRALQRERARFSCSGDPEAESRAPFDLPQALELDPEQLLQQKERRDLVMREINNLPERYRTAVLLHYFRDRSYEEITRVLHVPIGTVKTWIFRARQQLKGQFQRIGLQIG